MNKLLDKILSEVALDQRVSNGMFNIEENNHMDALRDYLSNKGIDEDAVREFSNRVLEGKYPERQAYNVKGILVTFPTPEYKANAIKAGTHFEEDPMRKMSNIFSNPDPITAPKKDAAPEKEKSKTEPKTNLPVSQAAPAESPGDTPPEEPQPQTTAAPQQTPTPEPATTSDAEPVPPPVKSPEEKQADKNAIKTMLKGDDYMLDEVVTYVMYNAPHIMESIQRKLL